MAAETTKKTAKLSVAQVEINQLRKIAASKRTEQQQSRLDQLVAGEKRSRFDRLAVKRVNKAIKALNHVARLGNRNNYSYTDAEAAKIVAAILKSSEDTMAAFAETREQKQQFSL